MIIAAVSSFSALLMACTVAPESSESPPSDGEESLGETQQALANSSGGLLGSVCRACGCSWESTVKNGCTTWRCVCDSTEKANCVIKAPGGSAASTVVSDPTTPPKVLTGTFTTTSGGLLAP